MKSGIPTNFRKEREKINSKHFILYKEARMYQPCKGGGRHLAEAVLIFKTTHK